jgi:ribosomal protein S18 acetylase RimI-like enzyme
VIVRSLALQTELGLAASRGRVTDRGDYLVVETPDDPHYYDGNVLVLPAAPQVGEVGFWTRRFEAELGKNPAIRHVSLWWDGVTGDVGAREELEAAGFTIMSNQVMIADEITAPLGFAALPIRTLTADEVLATADVAYTIGDRHDDIYRLFLDRRAAWHSDLVKRNMATFWGAYDGELLVSSLGLAWVDQSFARYQDVQTLPSHRKRGIATALLATSARAAFEREIEHVVIVAEPGSEAARIYERLGFRTHERTANARRVTR